MSQIKSTDYKSVDYLKEQRFKREAEGGKSNQNNWNKYLNDQSLTEFEKLEEIKMKAEVEYAGYICEAQRKQEETDIEIISQYHAEELKF